MRILFVLHTFPPETWGGTELHAQAIAKELSSGHEVRIFCRSGDPRLPHGHLSHGFQDGLLVARFNNLFQDYDSIDCIHRYEPVHRTFVEELESFAPDVVHIHHLTNLSTTIVAECKSRGLPVVFTLHDFWTVCPRGQRLHPSGVICETIDRSLCHSCLAGLWPDWLAADEAPRGPIAIGDGQPHALEEFDQAMADAVRLCDVVLTPSEFHRMKMLEEIELDARRVVALPHGLDHDLFDGLHDPSPRPRVVGYIGSVIPVKGVDVLIDAFNIVGDANLELRIHGDAPVFHDDRDYLAELRERVRGPGVVRFMGHYDNGALPGILRDIDILVVPSLWWETFSLTIREAMLAGVPVVASDIGAMQEALNTSRAGLSFKTGDAVDLARVLRRLVKDRALRLRHANRRLEVKTLQRNAEELLEVYRQASEIAEKRKDSIVAKRPSFKAERRAAKAAPIGDKDLTIGVEKVGGGDVRIESSVERGEQTRVVFKLDYGSSEETNEVRLTIDFSAGDGSGAPRRRESSAAEVIPADAEVGSEALITAQSSDFDGRKVEESMYAEDGADIAARVERLDEMVATTALPEKDQVIRRSVPAASDDDEAPRKKRRRQRSRRDEDEKPPARPPEKPPTRDRDREPAARSGGGGGGGKKPAEDVVWSGDGKWGLPDKETKAPEPPKKAPNHRSGRQPNVSKADKGGSFGEGLGDQ